jgi:alkylated DNA repair protein (DNA oxidative demethylase)
MTLLFDTPPIAGMRYQEEIISEREERELIAHLTAIELSPFRFHGWVGKRKTQSFGWRYDFDDASFAPGDPIPDWLGPVRKRVASFTRLSPDDFVHVLLARYDPGAGIGWHRDRDVFDKVVGLSLNTPAMLRFRLRTGSGFKRANFEVQPRSAYLLTGAARHEWEHRISPGQALRFSITFRTLSEKGMKIAEVQG